MAAATNKREITVEKAGTMTNASGMVSGIEGDGAPAGEAPTGARRVAVGHGVWALDTAQWVWMLGSLWALHRLPFNPDLLLKQFAPSANITSSPSQSCGSALIRVVASQPILPFQWTRLSHEDCYQSG